MIPGNIKNLVELTLIEGDGDGAGATPAAVARVYGQPVLEVPTDLYIPPEALEVILENFEGPLDLLLYLIRRHNLDVLDIPMADLTRQYLEYVDAMRQSHLELAAEYLLMAAVLIEIKSRMLLPRPVSEGDGEGEVEDPRAELVRRLLEYEQMKLAGQRLHALPQAGRDYFQVQVAVERTVMVRLPDVDPEDLRQAWLGLIARAKASRHHHVTREQLSVREHMTRVLRTLKGRAYAEFGDLFQPERGVPELVVTLLAILELAKEYLVSVTQQAVFAPIYVRIKDGIAAD
ncbi:MAG: segregation/condensation protein A [Betaproteobacteria bacterium]|nr:segregation/condensation protein A [Betaproteobacteria bacterium]